MVSIILFIVNNSLHSKKICYRDRPWNSGVLDKWLVPVSDTVVPRPPAQDNQSSKTGINMSIT